MEWLIWFDVMMIVGIVAFLGFINAMGLTSLRSAGKESPRQRESANGADLRRETEAAQVPAGGKA